MKAYIFIKSILDRLIAFMLLIILLPILLTIAIAIKCDSKGPVLFKQKRVGQNKQLFDIWKFRTMRIDAPKDMPTHLFINAESYITRVGSILRKTSLDELPQLFNILQGKMSFIGPRPALWNQEDLIMARETSNVNSIKPGLTGWAQVNGRDELSISERAQYDVQYLNQISIFTDLKIIFLTIYSVFLGKGIVEGMQTDGHQKIK
nr:sugar transferase [uncultured Cellulosilyticum sp.]